MSSLDQAVQRDPRIVAREDPVEEAGSVSSSSSESLPPAPKRQKALAVTLSPSQKKVALNRSGYIPWINIVFSIMPEMRNGNYSAFAPFVTEFLRKHSIPDIRIVGSNGRKARAIPKESEAEFRAEFEDVYAGALSPSRNDEPGESSRSKKKSEKSTGRIPSSPSDISGVLFFDASSRPRQGSSIDALYKDGIEKVRFAKYVPLFSCIFVFL